MTVDRKIQPRNFINHAVADVRYVTGEVGKIRMPEFLMGILMVGAGVPVAGLFPLGTIAIMGLIWIGLRQRKTYEVPMMGLVIAVFILAYSFVTFSSIVAGDIDSLTLIKRIIRLVLVAILVIVIAEKRINLRSTLLGVGSGLVLNAIGFYAGIAPNNYGGVLSGWLNDKNVSGLYYAFFGFLLLTIIRKRSHQIYAFLMFSGFLWLTGSRTSMAAYVFAIIWVFISPNLNIIFKCVSGYLMILTVEFVEKNFAQAGEFADRAGSDALRERIDEASLMKVNEAPWQGIGLGKATVHIQERDFFFHNSYWSLLVEGGWVYLSLTLFLSLVCVFLWKQANSKRVTYAEAAMVLLFICAGRLGEVFLTFPWSFALGLALSYTAFPISKLYELKPSQ